MNNPELRQKSIQESIVGKSGRPSSRVIDYCPGNGTRYLLVISDLGGIEKWGLDLLGRTGRCYLVSWMNGGVSGRCMTVGSSDFLHYSYVREKLGCSEVDAVVLAEAIAHFCGLTAVSCEQYEARG